MGADLRVGHHRSGRTSGSRSSSCRRGCRASPTSCSKPRASTARARGRGSGTSRCRCCRRRCSSPRSSAPIFAFQAFGQIDILTKGGPSDHTNVLVYAIYRRCSSVRHRTRAAAAVLVDRAVRDHAGAHADPAPVPRTAGAPMSGERRAADSLAPGFKLFLGIVAFVAVLASCSPPSRPRHDRTRPTSRDSSIATCC